MSPVIIGNATRIYALAEWPSMAPRYVGKTVQPLRLRLAAHLRASRKPRLPVHYWIAKRKENICIKWLETVPAGDDWASRERHWIAEARAGGASILNLTDGGEGHAGRTLPAQHRMRIAVANMTGELFPCAACGVSVYRKRNQIKPGARFFCSRKCANPYNKGGFRDA